MGQPTKLTPERKERILSYLVTGVTVEVAARASGIEPQTHYNWFNRGKPRRDDEQPHTEQDAIYVDYFEDVMRARAEREAYLAGLVMKHATDDWRAALAMLQAMFPERWNRQRLELTGSGGAPIEVRPVPPQPLDQQAVEAMRAVLQRANLVPADNELPSGNGHRSTN